MRTRRVVVGRRHSGSSDGISMLNESHHISHAGDDFFFQSDNLDLLLAILQHAQLLFSIQKVKYLYAHNMASYGTISVLILQF